MSEPIKEEVKPVAPVVEEPDPLKEIKAKLTTEEKETFFKCFLSDQQYEDIVLAFNGKLKLQFRTLSVMQNDVIDKQQNYDKEAGIVRTDNTYVIKIVQYRVASSLVAINDEPFCKDINEQTKVDDKSTYLVKRLETMQKWPLFKLSNITEAFNKFEMKVMALTQESFKENF